MRSSMCLGMGAVLSGLMLAVSGWAQPPEPPAEIRVKEKVRIRDAAPPPADVRVKEKVRVREAAPPVEGAVVHEQHHHHFIPHRSSEMIGMHVQTIRGSEAGVVKDFVLDCMTGRVKYVVVSFRAFPEIGERLHAVPWEAFECKPLADHGHVLVVDVTEDVLLKAPTFTAERWPVFSEPKWYETNDVFYRENFRFPARAARRDVDVNVRPGEIRRDIREDGRDIRQDFRQEGRDVQQDLRQEGREIRQEGRQIDREIRQEGREINRDIRRGTP